MYALVIKTLAAKFESPSPKLTRHPLASPARDLLRRSLCHNAKRNVIQTVTRIRIGDTVKVTAPGGTRVSSCTGQDLIIAVNTAGSKRWSQSTRTNLASLALCLPPPAAKISAPSVEG